MCENAGVGHIPVARPIKGGQVWSDSLFHVAVGCVEWAKTWELRTSVPEALSGVGKWGWTVAQAAINHRAIELA